jgi:hypothetical protein
MYETFLQNFEITSSLNEKADESLTSSLDFEISAFFSESSGLSLNNGVYKTHTPNSSVHWSILIGNYFPNFSGKLIPFGFDWMGRQFAVHASKTNIILMFDPSTAEYFELEQRMDDFHNNELVNDKESILSESQFRAVTESLSMNSIAYDSCLGYKIPLFLNGSDEITNYEISDIEVYWEFMRQVYVKIKDLPDGTRIETIKFDKP